MGVVGKSIPRVDGAIKADGTLKYTNDLEFDGLFAHIVRSSVASGEILSISFDANFDFSAVTIVDYRDIQKCNVNPVILDDQPFLAEKYVRFIGEPILLLAHHSQSNVVEASKHIEIEYKEQEPLLDMEDAFTKKLLIFEDDNIYKNIKVNKHSADTSSELMSLTQSYTTSHQEQLYIEPQSMLARYREKEIKIIGSMQCPFYVETSLKSLTGEKIEIEQAPTGGAFGGKEDYPSLMAAYVYLLSKKAKKDVKLVLSRSEDIAFTTKRHPSKITLTTEFDRLGKLYSLDAKIWIDGGAYATLSPVVLARVVLHVAGFYDINNIDIDAYALATNTPPNGAFRGFGAPQALFAIERHMDEIAKRLDILPSRVREINLPNQDTKSLTGVAVKEYERVKDIFQRAREQSEYDAKFQREEPHRGIGMALFMHGGGFVGLGEEYLASEVLIKLNVNGVVDIKIGSTEMGQGAMTVLPQIVADVLEIDPSFVIYNSPNTKKVADSGPTVSSRTVMVVGTLLKEAALKLKKAVGNYNSVSEYITAVTTYLETQIEDEFRAKYKTPKELHWDEDKFYGNGYSAYSLGCYVTEVEVDSIDFRVRVTNFYALNDVGEVINPTLAQGQVEGGVTQGIGYALYENLAYLDGKIKNPHLSDYIIPMAADLEKIVIEFLNTNESAKGLGELPMDGVAPAIANAIANALNVECRDLPITPERLERLCR